MYGLRFGQSLIQVYQENPELAILRQPFDQPRLLEAPGLPEPASYLIALHGRTNPLSGYAESYLEPGPFAFGEGNR